VVTEKVAVPSGEQTPFTVELITTDVTGAKASAVATPVSVKGTVAASEYNTFVFKVTVGNA